MEIDANAERKHKYYKWANKCKNATSSASKLKVPIGTAEKETIERERRFISRLNIKHGRNDEGQSKEERLDLKKAFFPQGFFFFFQNLKKGRKVQENIK